MNGTFVTIARDERWTARVQADRVGLVENRLSLIEQLSAYTPPVLDSSVLVPGTRLRSTGTR